MIQVTKQGPCPEGRRGGQATNVEGKIRFSTMYGPRGREGADDRLYGIPEGGAESHDRRMRQGNAWGQMMYQKPVRAKNQVGKARDAVLRGKQNHDRPMMHLVTMAKAQRFEARRPTRPEGDCGSWAFRLLLVAPVRGVHA